jgi:hypothetical protein
MPAANRIARIYAYLVCIIAIGVFLGGAVSIVGAMFDRAEPLLAARYGEPLTSFEAYKASHGNANPARQADKSAAIPDTLSDAALRQAYDALAADRVARVRFDTAKTFGTSGLLIVLCVALFATHWSWARRLREPDTAPGA